MTSLGILLLMERPDIWALLVHGEILRTRKSIAGQIYREKNRAQISERRRKKYALLPFPALNRAKKWYEDNKQHAIEAAKYRHQLTLAAATRPRPEVCECCGKAQPHRALSFDHCHNSGAFRGWLCVKCNVGIGALGDTIEGLMQAIAYLRGTNG